MAFITTHYNILNKSKQDVEVTSELGKEIVCRVNNRNLSPKERFINSMRDFEGELVIFRDSEEEFCAYDRKGTIYCYFQGSYYVVYYPKPSLIPTAIINALIEEETKCKDYDNLAELYRFLSLTKEERDNEGFAFYHWIWADGIWDNKAKYFNFGEEDMTPTISNKELAMLAELKRKLEED